MIRRHLAISSMLTGITALLVFLEISHMSETHLDKFYVLLTGASGIAVSGIAIISAIVASIMKKRIVAIYSGLLALLSGIVAFVPSAMAEHRVAVTKAKLSDVYSSIVARGTPFPDVYDFSIVPDSDLLISPGYWVADDRTMFEIYYHLGSDSYTLAYPNQNWEWRGYGYEGPFSDNESAEQAGLGNPLPRPVVKPEGVDKPQPESEGRSR